MEYMPHEDLWRIRSFSLVNIHSCGFSSFWIDHIPFCGGKVLRLFLRLKFGIAVFDPTIQLEQVM
jgi:hypothetical protein